MSIYTLIPLIPLASALILALFGKQLHGKGHRLVVPAVGISFVVSVLAFVEVMHHGAVRVQLYSFINVGQIDVTLGFYIDQLTVLLLLLVTGVSAVVQVYASRYMIGDSRHSRFFALTALFTAAMTLLVMSSNLLITFIFWELMGICSYLLISHYAQRPSAARAATKVFLVNSVADVGLFVGIILTFVTFGTLDIPEILAIARSGSEISTGTITILTLCLFCGAVGKSAQMPAHVWLPFAMEAPTPVSALIHAATMVNAGPFLLVRLSPVLVMSPTAMTVIGLVGATTALFAAIVSLTQTDIKRSLAYSTISQLGFMTMLCGVGAFVAAIFHLIAHGFFKAFLFLSTGKALSGTHRHLEAQEQPSTVSKGGLFLGALIMSLIPAIVFFSGPYRYLWLSQSISAAGLALWAVSLGTIFFTAMYLCRSVISVFSQGPTGASDSEPTVAPALFSAQHVIGVSVVAAIMVALLIGVWSWFAGFLSPAVGGIQAQSVLEFSPVLLAPLGAALAGWAFAYLTSNKPHSHQDFPSTTQLYVFFLNKGYFDEIYDAFLVRPTLKFARWTWKNIDQGIVDRLVLSLGKLCTNIGKRLGYVDPAVDNQVKNIASGIVTIAKGLEYVDTAVDNQIKNIGTGSVTIAGWIGRFIDTAGISRTLDGIGEGVDATGRTVRRYEPRTMQSNLLVVVFWLATALCFFYWIAR